MQEAIAKLPGVDSVNVLLSSEKAIIRMDPTLANMLAIRQAVASAGSYSVPDSAEASTASSASLRNFTNRIVALFTFIFGAMWTTT